MTTPGIDRLENKDLGHEVEAETARLGASSAPSAVADLLAAAADLIEPEGRWTRKEMARNKDGRYVEPNSPDAVCWCMAGAVHRVAPGDWTAIIAVNQIRNVTLGSVSLWNDAPGRTQAEVVTVLRAAAEKARLRDLALGRDRAMDRPGAHAQQTSIPEQLGRTNG